MASDLEKVNEWVRYYQAAILKFGALRAVYRNDGEKMLESVLEALKLQSASDVVKACKSPHE